MRNIELEEMKLLKQGDKSRVLLMRERDGERVFVQKVLKGSLEVYSELLGCSHPYLPRVYEVQITDNATTVLEEYIEGQSIGSGELSEKRLLGAMKELCSVLEFLHERGVIHRDIKPSNILLAKDKHIRLIDFDAARMPKENLEQDTRLLGTRGYAPPEQYGFAQTDERTDIYSFGVTFEQLLGDKAHKPKYRRILRKCTSLDPDKRYQSAREVKRALSGWNRGLLVISIGILLLVCLGSVLPRLAEQSETALSESPALTALPAPENPRWDGETGIGLWGNVPESGVGGEAAYCWRLYRRDSGVPPDPNEKADQEGDMSGNGVKGKDFPTYEMNLGTFLKENGIYYFAVCAVGDGVHYADSPFVVSDPFEYLGQFAPPLPRPTGLAWKVLSNNGPQHYAVFRNLDDYLDTDSFHVRVYNQDGIQVNNNIWTKEDILTIGQGGVWFAPEVFEEGKAYRFTVQVQTSRPNQYKSSPMPDPVPEEYYSPWYYPSDNKNED